MNRSHKHQLQKLRSKNIYTKADLEVAKELLNQNDPPFKRDVKEVIEKITTILEKENNETDSNV